jgi:hypothetical protein
MKTETTGPLFYLILSIRSDILSQRHGEFIRSLCSGTLILLTPGPVKKSVREYIGTVIIRNRLIIIYARSHSDSRNRGREIL